MKNCLDSTRIELPLNPAETSRKSQKVSAEPSTMQCEITSWGAPPSYPTRHLCIPEERMAPETQLQQAHREVPTFQAGSLRLFHPQNSPPPRCLRLRNHRDVVCRKGKEDPPPFPITHALIFSLSPRTRPTTESLQSPLRSSYLASVSPYS